MKKKVKKSIGFHYLLTKNTVLNFYSFDIEHIPQEELSKPKYKSIIHNNFRIQYDDSIRCGFYFIAFAKYMIAGKTLLDCTNSFSPSGYKNT